MHVCVARHPEQCRLVRYYTRVGIGPGHDLLPYAYAGPNRAVTNRWQHSIRRPCVDANRFADRGHSNAQCIAAVLDPIFTICAAVPGGVKHNPSFRHLALNHGERNQRPTYSIINLLRAWAAK